jgi:hypothetical protein
MERRLWVSRRAPSDFNTGDFQLPVSSFAARLPGRAASSGAPEPKEPTRPYRGQPENAYATIPSGGSYEPTVVRMVDSGHALDNRSVDLDRALDLRPAGPQEETLLVLVDRVRCDFLQPGSGGFQVLL